MTIRRMSAPPVFAMLRWYQNSTNPPTKRANEKDGVFRNPIAKATPDGIHRAYGRARWTAMSLMPAMTENKRANSNMNELVFSGSCLLPVTPRVNSSSRPRMTPLSLTKQTRKVEPHVCGRGRERRTRNAVSPLVKGIGRCGHYNRQR